MITRFIAFCIIVLSSFACTPRVSNYTNIEEAKKAAGDGIVFKQPSGFGQIPMNNFKGLLFLNPEKPVVIFVTYPNDGETLEDLKNRLKSFAFEMFAHKKADSLDFKWQSFSVPSHKGDLSENGTLNLNENEKNSIQISIYEREWNGLKYVYGFIAMKNKTANENETKGIWANEKGDGIIGFEEFWTNLPSK